MIVESGRAAEVVRRLRDFFRTGAMQLEAVEASALIDGMARQFAPLFHEHGIELVLAPPSPLAVNADRLQIELVCVTCWPMRRTLCWASRAGSAASRCRPSGLRAGGYGCPWKIAAGHLQ
jgi:hypothetical protein